MSTQKKIKLTQSIREYKPENMDKNEALEALTPFLETLINEAEKEAAKDMRIEKIIVCAYSENHYKIIEQIGVQEIIFPQRDIAAWLGKKLSMKNVLDYIPLAGEYVVMNVRPPKSFVGTSIRDLQIGARFQCQILGIKYLEGNESWNPDKPEWENMKIAPTANEVIPENSVLLFLGKRSDLKRIQEMD